MEASYYGKLEVIKLLLDTRADPNKKAGDICQLLRALHIIPLGAALANGNETKATADIIRLLLESGAEVDGGNDWRLIPLMQASNRGLLESVKLLLNAGADPNAKGGRYGSPLGAAADDNRIEVLNLLLDSGAEVDGGDEEHGTPLMQAVYSNECESVMLLLDSRADPNARGGDYGGPLRAAVASLDLWRDREGQ
ncbi:MAG: hypothetical protein MMC33_008678 [Icmadophila ericetorum]|nr:hypothetical protein [Icmadophila ericetorum]